MNWIPFLIASFCCLVICDGLQDSSQGQSESSCGCGGDDVTEDCRCEYYEDGYKERVIVIIVGSVTVVGVLGVIVGCCVYNKSLKKKWTKKIPEQFVEVNQDSKQVQPHELVWTTLPSAPPPYTCTTLPYYHPESRDTSVIPPLPYT